MVSKFTQKDIEKLEAEAEINLYEIFRQNCPQLGLDALYPYVVKEFQLGQRRCAPHIWNQCETRGPELKRLLFARTVYIAILDDSKINNYERVCNNLEPFMTGSRDGVGPSEKQAYNTFKYCKELSVAAMRHFADHFARTEYFGFGSSAYDQWFSSLRLGLNSNPDRVLSGIGNLNYPDTTDPSPRLKALKEYLEVIYRLRIRVQILDILVRNREHAGTSPNITMGQWENFVKSVQERLTAKFGANKASVLFQKMFGSDNPTAPTSQAEFSNIQNEVLTKISEAILADQMGQDWEPQPLPRDGFHRDYAKEQREREARERENQRRRERENPDWANINPQFHNNDPLVKEWTKRNFTHDQAKEWIDIGIKPNQAEYAQFLRDVKQQTSEQFLNEGDMEQLQAEYQEWKTKPQKQKDQETKNSNIDDKPKPTEESKDKKRDKSPSRKAAEDKLDGKETKPPVETGFNSSDLNDTLNSLSGALADDTKNSGNNQPFTPAPGLGQPLTTMTKEDAERLPWLVMGFGIDTDGSSLLHKCPHWSVKDPATAAALRHGEGDLVTLLLSLFRSEIQEEALNVPSLKGEYYLFHNFFWAKNADKKGYERLVKDTEPAKEGEGETKLLITGTRADDPRADKLGWNAWPWKKDLSISFGVPGVKQKSYRFTRWARTYDKAYDLEDTSHFIGILKGKGLFGGFKVIGNGRVAGWGNGPKKSILWITNQLKYPGKTDWAGDDTQTINPNNGFSHYLIFSDFSTQEINDQFLETGFYGKNNTATYAAKSLAELIGRMNKEGKTVLVRIGPDTLELIDSQTPAQKDRSKDETPETRKDTTEKVTPEDLKDIGLTQEEFDLLNAAFTDPAHIANIIKKLAQAPPEKMAQMLNKMFDTIHEKTREAMFNQMVDNNPVFTPSEKELIKKRWQEANPADKKALWKEITSGNLAKTLHKSRSTKEKDKIFEEQVNKNPRYGPSGVDTQERRDRFEEYTKADDSQKEQMQSEENERFTTGENANQWGNYFQDNANRECGAGDESVGTETDNNFSGQFSFADSLAAINKLKNIGSMKPAGMEEGMRSNKPYWGVVFSHPLTYIFLFIGIIIAIMAAATKKNR